MKLETKNFYKEGRQNAKRAEEWLDLALKSKDLKKKLEYCTKYLELEPNDRDVWDYKGNILQDLGESREAVHCFENAYKGTDVAYKAGVIFIGQNDEKAIEVLSEVVEKDQRAWILKGMAFLNLKRPEEAIACLDKALEAKIGIPCHIQALFWKGSALIDLGKFEEAIKCFDNLLDMDPGAHKAWYIKGYILLHNLERYEEAIVCLNEALNIYPDFYRESVEELIRRAEKKLRGKEKKGFFKKLFG